MSEGTLSETVVRRSAGCCTISTEAPQFMAERQNRDLSWVSAEGARAPSGNSGFGAAQCGYVKKTLAARGGSSKFATQRNGSGVTCLRSPHVLTLTFTSSCRQRQEQSPACCPRRVLRASRGCLIARGVCCLLTCQQKKQHLAASRFCEHRLTSFVHLLA